MLRPFYLDWLDMLLPLCAGVAALVGGRYLDRLPSVVFRGGIGLAVAVVLLLGGAYFTPMRGLLSDALWHVGGITTLGCAIAMLLVGVVWSARGRSTSTAFLRTLVGLVAVILVLNSGGRLYWRCVSETPWHNAPDAAGRITQTTGCTCFPASATMLLHRYGIATTEGEMAYLAGTSFLGTDAPSMARALTWKGETQRLVAHVVYADYATCLQQTGPFLACINVPGLGGHAVLVLRTDPDDIELIDPRFGHRQTMTRADIEPHWDGKIVYLEIAQ